MEIKLERLPKKKPESLTWTEICRQPGLYVPVSKTDSTQVLSHRVLVISPSMDPVFVSAGRFEKAIGSWDSFKYLPVTGEMITLSF